MAQTNYTPISLYYSTTAAAAPLAANLVNGELAINITDGKLFYKDNGGNVQTIAGKGGSGVVAGANTQVQFNNNGVFGASSSLTWNGSTLAVTGNVTATTDSTFNSTGALQISSGTTAQRPTGVVGKIRWNTDLSQYEGYNGSSWTLLGGAVISNDTSTSSYVYPAFSSVTSGNASTLYTSNAKLLYKPSTGELQASLVTASNGMVLTSQTVAVSVTIPAGYSAMSSGPVTVASGQSVTVPSGSRWVVV